MDIKLFEKFNVTQAIPAYEQIERRSMLCDRKQNLIWLAAFASFIATILFVFLGQNRIALLLIALTVILLWIRPLCSLFVKQRSLHSIKTVFDEREFVQTDGDAERRYFYSGIKRVTIFDGWLLLEVYRKRVILDANGFAGITADEFIDFLRKNFPTVPIKRKGNIPSLRILIPLALATVFCIVATDVSAYFMQKSVPSTTEVSASNNGVSQLPTAQVNDSRLLADRLVTRDCDLFSIDLPESLTFSQKGTMLGYVSDLREQILVWVIFIPKNYVTMKDWPTLDAYVEFAYQQYEAAGEITPNAIGGLSFEFSDEKSDTYCTNFETERDYVSIGFSTYAADYDEYLPYFRSWEETIAINETPTGSVFSEIETWETEDIKISLPFSFTKYSGDDYSELVDHDDVFITIKSTEKEACTPQEAFSALMESLGGYILKSGDIKKSDAGNDCCRITHPDAPSFTAYAVLFETESRYVVVLFEVRNEVFEKYEQKLYEWESSIVPK